MLCTILALRSLTCKSRDNPRKTLNHECTSTKPQSKSTRSTRLSLILALLKIMLCATACGCYDKNVQSCVRAVSTASLPLGLLRSQQKTPRGSRNVSYLRDRNTAWAGGQEREAMRRQEGSELITYYIVCGRPSHIS